MIALELEDLSIPRVVMLRCEVEMTERQKRINSCKLGEMLSFCVPLFFFFFFFFFFFCIDKTQGQSSSSGNVAINDNGNGNGNGNGNMLTGPGLAIVIGVLSIMFAMVFLLLVYAKYCRRAISYDLTTDVANENRFGFGFDFGLGGRSGELRTASSRFSGIDKTVIESLPFFRFSSLKGAREGLECAVCLSKFEDIEILRLVPKCKHAFHIDCVDRWLENHSSCPLCRQKVDPSDLTIFTYSNSLRISSNLVDESNLELFVHREQDNDNKKLGILSSKFSIGSSRRKMERGNEGEELPIKEEQVIINEENDDDRKLLHKFKHMIIVSDVVCKNRWSDVNSSDLMLLNSEMLRVMSSKRFDSSASSSERFTSAMASFDNGSSSNSNDQQIMKIKEEIERKREFESKIKMSHSFSNSNLPLSTSALGSRSEANPINLPGPLVPSGARSVSETSFSRFPADYIAKNRIRQSVHRSGKDERIRKVWIPIARRTVQWFAGREKRSQQQSNYTSNV
ncbi:hypothetical protein NE237_030158 [Protea cynaroides]|uniref:RING-type E3 ubiquitin transferase n=1 Tax=Protea cynaroides TaxID=273540 RepID=A0A9Q0JVH8_9MAGN|nr:hypothetical protein NE237_030158 [Protea cynaroides]